MKSVFTVDVEDWFHILDVPSTPPISEWDMLPSRVEKNFRKLLEIFAAADVKVTCFFLGWIGQKYPHLVKEAYAAGHEIASHGHAHQLVHRNSETEFLHDISIAKRILEDISGDAVIGYRAPGFSLTSHTPWFFAKVAEAGYRYDSSVCSARHGHGEVIESQSRPYRIETDRGTISE